MKYNKRFYKDISSDMFCYVGIKSYKELFYENYLLKRKLDKIKELLENSINGINEKLKVRFKYETYLNDYRVVRLKAIRTKCKEILDKFF